MAGKHYPEEISRINYNVGLYAEMAMESFYTEDTLYKKIKENNYSICVIDEYNELNKAVVCAIVFSAMTIEAFLNDYLAACIGDKDFKDNYDKLSVLGKFQLINQFIFKTKIDKSKSYYSYLKKLFTLRDSHVHSKSKEFTLDMIENNQDFDESYNDVSVYEISVADKDEIEKDYRDAKDALMAIKEIAEYFDMFDSNVHAVTRVFYPYFFGKEDKKYIYKKPVLSLLGIEATDYEI